ncbi:hypothetical protein [Cupriavidus lacunae]|uniref:Uncharacterized protein n=1 Tax=Cupriavidus lacunae TaxID=2666307 RepID=A0A370NJP2_9BURK|nr:hypothetical protein [Cupriavidus lacunae]RDK05815.1 hypothetical protein DN412_34770 [Cupriavidus lacunae]
MSAADRFRWQCSGADIFVAFYGMRWPMLAEAWRQREAPDGGGYNPALRLVGCEGLLDGLVALFTPKSGFALNTTRAGQHHLHCGVASSMLVNDHLERARACSAQDSGLPAHTHAV